LQSQKGYDASVYEAVQKVCGLGVADIAVKRDKRGGKDDKGTAGMSQVAIASMKKAELEELEVCSRFRHKNLCCLLAIASDGPQKCLIFQYCPGGSVHDRLAMTMPGKSMLTITERFRIALDAAEGLSFLHTSGEVPVLHRDVKSDNLLLDADGSAKVCDFGTARHDRKTGRGVTGASSVSHAHTHMSTKMVVGTRAYMPPEYLQHGHVSVKTDAFAFGTLLMELLTGLAPTYENQV
jgi:serine/threonine protein kinase